MVLFTTHPPCWVWHHSTPTRANGLRAARSLEIPDPPTSITTFQHPPSENFSLARGPPTIVYINPILDKATSMKLYMSIVMTGTGELYKVLSVHFSNSYDASRTRDYQFNIGQSHIDEVIHVHNGVWDKIIV